MMDFVTVTCWRCKVQYGMTREFYNVAKAAANNLTFYCPNGHGASFIQGETEADKLRRERDQLQQRLAQKDDEIAWQAREKERERERAERSERKISAAKGQITKLKKRAAAGMCPCCNRAFANLHAHMSTQHPHFVAEPDATETVTQ